MKWSCWSTVSLTSALDEGRWLRSCPDRFTPENKLGTHFRRDWVSIGTDLDGRKKISPLQSFESRTAQPPVYVRVYLELWTSFLINYRWRKSKHIHSLCLKHIFKKWDAGGLRTGLTLLKVRQVTGCCEWGGKLSGYIIWNFLTSWRPRRFTRSSLLHRFMQLMPLA
jgi:hypothetical protein